MSHWLMGELNYCSLSFKTNEIGRCIRHVEADWKTIKRPSDRELMLKNAKVGRSIAIIAAVCMNLGIFSDSVVTGLQKSESRLTNGSDSMFRLPCPVYSHLLDVSRSPLNQIVYSMQILSALIANSVTVGACGLASVFAMHACGQLNVVMSQLDSLVESSGDQAFAQKRLTSIVKLHLRALNFVWYIEKIMHMICLVELLGCTINLCMIEYYILTERSKKRTVTYIIV
ncbi:uncharacterized protein LOC144477943, partial [Augochlora pura]